MAKRCLHMCYFSFFLALVILLWNSGLIYLLEPSDNLNDARLSLEEDDWVKLAFLDPFKDLEEIKAIAHRRYEPRRAILKRTCNNIKDPRILRSLTPQPGKWESYIWYNFERGYSFCGVAKVASSTWRSHNRDLVGKQKFDAYLKALEDQGKGHTWYSKVSYHFAPLPTNMTIQEASSQLLTFVFVRHPFARFVSSYQDKIVDAGTKKKSQFNNHIIHTYRKKGALSATSDIPTPLEFSLYVLDEAAKYGVENLNPHWQSQWGCCPFCTLDFDIIGHLETFQRDMDFIVRAMNWQDVLASDRHENTALSKSNDAERKMRLFFSQLPKNVTWALFKLYEMDFQMFGYGGPEQWYAMGY